MNFFFVHKRPRPQRRVLEVEVLEDRLPLSASPLSPAALPLAAPTGAPVRVAPFVVTAPTGNTATSAAPSSTGTVVGPNNNIVISPEINNATGPTIAPLTVPNGGQQANPVAAAGLNNTTFGAPTAGGGFGSSSGFANTSPYGNVPTPGAAPLTGTYGPVDAGASYFSTSMTPFNRPQVTAPPFGQTAAPLAALAGAPPLSPVPQTGVLQQSAPTGNGTLPIARQISGIDSTVFDPRANDTLRLRDMRFVRGMDDNSGPRGLELGPSVPPSYVPPPPRPTPAAPSYAPQNYPANPGTGA